MTRRNKIIILSIILAFYLPVNFSASGLPIKQWFSLAIGGAEIPVCGCEDDTCCCGAPCCAPKTEDTPATSCCEEDSNNTVASKETTDTQWKAACTCGQSHDAGLMVLVDPHFPAQGDPSTLVLFLTNSNHFLARNWPSLVLAPPDHVPKHLANSMLFTANASKQGALVLL